MMLLFDGLHCFGNQSICRIRIVSTTTDPSRIVIATHLADSPGASISNDFEALVASVVADFGERPTQWLLHFPASDAPPAADELTWIDGIPDGNEPRWLHLSRTEVEALTGLDLSSAETETSTVAEIAGDRGLLRGLAQTPEPERHPREYLRVVSVTALPFAHSPFRCPHKARFTELSRCYDDTDRTVVGAHWYLTLKPEHFAECPFHAGNWRAVAEASINVLESLTVEGAPNDVAKACAEQNLPAQDAEWLRSLFAGPIDWTPGSSTLTNGQHRSCALRAAGAEQCVVDTSGYTPPQSNPASSRAAASAALATYWAKRTAWS